MMKDFGWSWENMVDMPVSAFMVLSEERTKMLKEEEKRMKKKGKR